MTSENMLKICDDIADFLPVAYQKERRIVKLLLSFAEEIKEEIKNAQHQQVSEPINWKDIQNIKARIKS